MNPNPEPRPDDPELEAIIETAAEDALDAAFEPDSGAPPVVEPPSEDDGSAAEAESRVVAGAELDESAPAAEPGPAPKLERLQKILAQAGVASRRHAEELIAAGRVQVNGQVVTTPGSKADATRDHIRVDGKLIHSAERHRYFMLNKPKGFVTTVSDPEGRPTVMQFFGKAHERLYPVGRLDYQSEGLLLVTNDGELANRLTHAASGVEKTYLVKVSGRPTAAELDALRRGVAIDRGRPGTPRVETAPARVREVRKGDNPWFEVVLIEGRNRELRKMFQEIGHFVEKIRRVGYGPLVLDIEPGKTRELTADEIAALRRAAEGKPAPARAGKESRRDGERDREARRAGGREREHGREHERERSDERRREPVPRPGRWDGRAGEKRFPGKPVSGRGFRGADRRRFSSNPERSLDASKKRTPKGPASGHDFSRADQRPKFASSERASAREDSDRRARPPRFRAEAPAHRERGGARPGGERRRPPNLEESRGFASRPRRQEGRSEWRARDGRRGRGSAESGFSSSPGGSARRRPGSDSFRLESRGGERRRPASDSSRFEPRGQRRGGAADGGRDRSGAHAKGPDRNRGRSAREPEPTKDRRPGRPAGGPRGRKPSGRSGPGQRGRR